ncbi:MAG: hypothetical protein IPQ15_15570 [Betaproteobacteria bacterium]|nr:hypothetical protein [Betaproteobacteria bacterium]
MGEAEDGLIDAEAARLGAMLCRSDELSEAILVVLGDSDFDPSPRGLASFAMCGVSMEHGLAIRLSIAAGLATAAISLMRLQFESLVRAMWLLYASNDRDIAKLMAPLSLESEQAAKNLPTANAMIDDIGESAGTSAPAQAHQMLVHFRDVQMKALNSFVHAGIHPLRRHAEGYPMHLILQVVESSNALATMAGMTLAILTCDEAMTLPMSRIQRAFEDCLPTLLR